MKVAKMGMCARVVHYATHDTMSCLMHGHRKLRLAEDVEILRLAPDMRQTCMRQTCIMRLVKM